MKLYNFPWGPYPRRISIYLREKGVRDLQTVEVEFPHQPDLWPSGFLGTLNPAHSLPVLETEEGLRIGQSLAIIEYLEEKLTGPNLLGLTAEDRALTRAMVAVIDEATSFFGLWARQGSAVNADRHNASGEAAAIGAKRFASKLKVTESMLVGPYLTGDAVTIADCVAMALFEFTSDFYGVEVPRGCPKLRGWLRRFAARPSVIKPFYPPQMLERAFGLPQQTGIHL